MLRRTKKETQLFYKYFEDWIQLYKLGAVREVTLNKYYMTNKRLKELVPDLRLCDLSRTTYQQLLNAYAQTHEKQTTLDFHHQVKGSIMDAVEDGLLKFNPTRKVVIKGKIPKEKRQKFLNQFELQSLLKQLELSDELNWDWFILLTAKTGLRFSETLALTPQDFDFSKQKLQVSKSWNYRNNIGNFQPTKNESSNRKLSIDWQTSMHFCHLIKGLDPEQPIFVKKRVFNSTVNNRLKVICEKADIPIITVHSLRHTHASLLLYAGVSIASVAKRLGHSSMTTTQETYLHIIKELENQDDDKIMRHLANL